MNDGDTRVGRPTAQELFNKLFDRIAPYVPVRYPYKTYLYMQISYLVKLNFPPRRNLQIFSLHTDDLTNIQYSVCCEELKLKYSRMEHYIAYQWIHPRMIYKHIPYCTYLSDGKYPTQSTPKTTQKTYPQCILDRLHISGKE
jgi:hypothetical protein